MKQILLKLNRKTFAFILISLLYNVVSGMIFLIILLLSSNTMAEKKGYILTILIYKIVYLFTLSH